MKTIVIIGKLPPPIGGVTIHTQRLLSFIRKDDRFKAVFYQNSLANLVKAPLFLLAFKVFHLHSSNPYIRLYYALIGKVLSRRVIITIHGDLGRFSSSFKNYCDRLSIKLCWIPIVLNDNSYSIAEKINNSTLKISSFIPPFDEEGLKVEYLNQIDKLKEQYETIFCTNAYAMSFDKDCNEIYGILEIIDYFKQNNNVALIFSDPSAQYQQYFQIHDIKLSENIFHIVENHSYYEVLCLSKISIRNTTTDGDSLSVKESLYLNKVTLATNVVSRPHGCIVYKPKQLNNCIDEVLNNMGLPTSGISIINNAYEELSKLYLLS